MGRCGSTPAKHAASPYQPKRHANAKGKLEHYILLNRTLLSLSYVSLTVVHLYGYVNNTCPSQFTYLFVRSYTEPNRSGLGRNRYGTNKYS